MDSVKKWWIILLLCFGATAAFSQQKSLYAPLGQGHAHNDYWGKEPLYGALKAGFKSVEADVFLKEGKLLVGHDLHELQPDKTLQSMYLDPLYKQIKEHKRIFTEPKELWLYVDIKNEGQDSYAVLAALLQKYEDMLIHPQSKGKGFVKVILTGSYPRSQVLADRNRIFFLDGNLQDLGKDKGVFPAISSNWQQNFTWKGEGKMPMEEAKRLGEYADKAKSSGQKLRFWNIPEKDKNQISHVWDELLMHDAILVGTDHLDWLKEKVEAHRAR